MAAAAESGTGAVRTAVRSPGRRRMLIGSLLFVSGFSAVFISFGALFGGLGRLLLEWAPVLTRVAGVVTIGMGLAFLGALPWLQRERRLHHRPSGGLAGAPVLGVVFGLGWTPCLGPTLAAVNTLAYTEASALRGAVLGLAYCLGLGVPFILFGLFFRKLIGVFRAVRRHSRWVTRAPRSWPTTANRSCPSARISPTWSAAVARLEYAAWAGAPGASWGRSLSP